MIRHRLWMALAAATVLLTSAPVAFADDWCSSDPLVKVVTPGGSRQSVHLTLGALGAEHRQAVHQATITWEATPVGGGTKVTITAIVPEDGTKAFPTRAQVSTLPFGAGDLLGSDTSTAGKRLVITYQVALP